MPVCTPHQGLRAGLVCLALVATPLAAETPEQLDAISRASEQPGSGIALARKQMTSGELLDALATLERVLLNHPGSIEARLLHASLLCRLDDRRGALLEFEDLRGRDYSDSLWQEATAPCSANSGAGREG